MKYIYNLIVLLIIASSAMKAMESSDNSSCYSLASRNLINDMLKSKYMTDIALLALTCHEFTEEDVVIKAQKILSRDPESINAIDFGIGRMSVTTVNFIKKKKEAGCFPASCKKLLDLINQTHEQLKQQKQQQEKKRQIEFEKEYQEALANFIKK